MKEMGRSAFIRYCWASFTALFVLVLSASPASVSKEAFPSTYSPLKSAPTLIINANVLTGTGSLLKKTNLFVSDGVIKAIGPIPNSISKNIRRIDADGKWITPGLIDVHSHLGVYPSPSVEAHWDGNEMTDPVTPDNWAEHSVWPQDPGFLTALAGGVTTMQVLPGSANLFGGRGVTLKNVPSVTYQGMKFPNAPHGLKMACGENPKRVYAEKERAPSTRMGNLAAYRAAWVEAVAYRNRWKKFELEGADYEPDQIPSRDLKLDTLRDVLDKKIIVHMHCYRADEMMTIVDMAKEFGYRVGTFHHAVEAYKIADTLAENGICAATWADWWGFKMEAFDGIQENIALVDRPENSCAVMHSDSEEGIQRLNQETAKAMARGNRAGLNIPPERAIQWITYNAAKSLGIEERTGSIEIGKMADLVIWNGDPFSVYSHADQVYIDGAIVYDRFDPAKQPVSDFMIGHEIGGGSL